MESRVAAFLTTASQTVQNKGRLFVFLCISWTDLLNVQVLIFIALQYNDHQPISYSDSGQIAYVTHSEV